MGFGKESPLAKVTAKFAFTPSAPESAQKLGIQAWVLYLLHNSLTIRSYRQSYPHNTGKNIVSPELAFPRPNMTHSLAAGIVTPLLSVADPSFAKLVYRSLASFLPSTKTHAAFSIAHLQIYPPMRMRLWITLSATLKKLGSQDGIPPSGLSTSTCIGCNILKNNS